jgi:hypothetical protein
LSWRDGVTLKETISLVLEGGITSILKYFGFFLIPGTETREIMVFWRKLQKEGTDSCQAGAA